MIVLKIIGIILILINLGWFVFMIRNKRDEIGNVPFQNIVHYNDIKDVDINDVQSLLPGSPESTM